MEGTKKPDISRCFTTFVVSGVAYARDDPDEGTWQGYPISPGQNTQFRSHGILMGNVGLDDPGS